jgi:UDP-glucose 4-epimerase
VVVTGGAGFIGSHAVERLLLGGHRVSVLDNFSTGHRENLTHLAAHPMLRVVEADIADGLFAPLQPLLADQGAPTHLLHLAAQTSVVASMARPLYDGRVNHLGTLHALELARAFRLRRVVFASSAATYGDLPPDQIPTSEAAPQAPLSLYGVHKLGGERLCFAYAQSCGVPATCLRFFNVYGPRQDPKSPYSGVITIFLRRALAGQPLVIFGDGLQTRDFVYVADVVEAISRALFAPSPPEGPLYAALNVGTGAATSVLDLARAVGALAASGSAPPAPTFEAARGGEIMHSRARVEQAQRVLGFEAQTPLAVGLQHTYAWMERQGL